MRVGQREAQVQPGHGDGVAAQKAGNLDSRQRPHPPPRLGAGGRVDRVQNSRPPGQEAVGGVEDEPGHGAGAPERVEDRHHAVDLEEEEDEYWEEEEIYEEVEGFEEIEHGLVREYLEQLNALPNEGRREQFREAVGDLFVRFNGMMAALEEAE